MVRPHPAKRASWGGRARKAPGCPPWSRCWRTRIRAGRRCSFRSGMGKAGGGVEIAPRAAVWSHNGLPPLPIRWVLIRDPKGRFKPQALLCTDLTVKPEQILQWFVLRWPVECTFHEVRTHLGVETQRQDRKSTRL